MQTVSVDLLQPGSEGPHWPPPALIDMQLSAYSPPRLRDLEPQDAPAALASGIPSITWCVAFQEPMRAF